LDCIPVSEFNPYFQRLYRMSVTVAGGATRARMAPPPPDPYAADITAALEGA
jgi:hypothetical protein